MEAVWHINGMAALWMGKTDAGECGADFDTGSLEQLTPIEIACLLAAGMEALENWVAKYEDDLDLPMTLTVAEIRQQIKAQTVPSLVVVDRVPNRNRAEKELGHGISER